MMGARLLETRRFLRDGAYLSALRPDGKLSGAIAILAIPFCIFAVFGPVFAHILQSLQIDASLIFVEEWHHDGERPGRI